MNGTSIYTDCSCPLCNSKECTEILSISNLPVHSHQLFKTAEAALKVNKGEIHLTYCTDCTHIFNRSFDPALINYNVSYENALHFSPVFRNYETKLAQNLINKYNLRGKSIADMGAGDGHFLKTICVLGQNTGLAIDSSAVAIDDPVRNIEIINTSIIDYDFEKEVDFISCRHVLEHIYDVDKFLKNLALQLRKNNVGIQLYFEVPNADYMIDNQSYFDILYEHCHYFTSDSLKNVFGNNGFHVDAIYTGYEKQFLCIEASLANEINPKISTINTFAKDRKDAIKKFGNKFKSTIANFKENVLKLKDLNKKMVLWGAGSKGITLLNLLNDPKIRYVVDINVRKHHHYISGTDIKIVPPDFLISYRPSIVIITNSIYKKEISQFLEKMQIYSKIISY
jgi:hypothetical protein